MIDNEKCLIVNVNNSRLAFSLYNILTFEKIVDGYIDSVGSVSSVLTLNSSRMNICNNILAQNYNDALLKIINLLVNDGFISDINDIKVVCHHLLYDGNKYNDLSTIDDQFIQYFQNLPCQKDKNIKDQITVATASLWYLPNAKQIAFFDSNFYRQFMKCNIPEIVMSNGFHGINHQYVFEKMKSFFAKDSISLIIVHLDRTSSICCTLNGEQVEATMVDDQSLENNIDIKAFYSKLYGKIDAIIFTGDKGIQNKTLREKIIQSIFNNNYSLTDDIRTDKGVQYGLLSKNGLSIPIFAIPKNEDFVILNSLYHTILENESNLQKSKKNN